MSLETFFGALLFYVLIVVWSTPDLQNIFIWALYAFGLLFIGKRILYRIPAVQQKIREKEAAQRKASLIALREETKRQQAEERKRGLKQQEEALELHRQRAEKAARAIRVVNSISERMRLESEANGAASASEVVLMEARGALEGGIFFDKELFSVKERIRIKKSGKPQFGVLPPTGHAAWVSEIGLWTAYAKHDFRYLNDSLEKICTKCSGCGRVVSARNKFRALSQLGKEYKLPYSYYWRQAILNAQWRTLKWRPEPADFLPPENPLDGPRHPLSAAALSVIRNQPEEVDWLGDENSPFPYFHVAKEQSEKPFASFWDNEQRHSDEAWEVAKLLSRISDRVDECLECISAGVKAHRSRLKLSPRQREAVMMRDGFRCQNCGRNAREDQVKLHIDHIVPWSKGGTDDIENLRTLCEECNLGKSDQVVV